MFSYYGSKSKIIDYYPKPKFDKIIEPFAGSARYSLKYWDRDITIVDKYKVVYDVWKYLQQATRGDILALPKMKRGDNVNDFNIEQVEKDFIGFLICRGMESPRKNVSSFVGDISTKLNEIANNIHKINHWTIIKGTYSDLKNDNATWFIDPPYQFGGEHYVESTKNINFNSLSEWCKLRNGHVIVCENTKADWMQFYPMIEMNGSQHKTTEAIWTNYPTSYNNNQLNAFE